MCYTLTKYATFSLMCMFEIPLLYALLQKKGGNVIVLLQFPENYKLLSAKLYLILCEFAIWYDDKSAIKKNLKKKSLSGVRGKKR